MRAKIIVDGHGTRISEETYLKPKLMIQIGNKKKLWYIVNISILMLSMILLIELRK
jgi:glucose-1-phosphate cytidylyltransferase